MWKLCDLQAKSYFSAGSVEVFQSEVNLRTLSAENNMVPSCGQVSNNTYATANSYTFKIEAPKVLG